jgi:hypothetical protein
MKQQLEFDVDKPHSGGYVTAVIRRQIGLHETHYSHAPGTNYTVRLPKFEYIVIAYFVPNLLTNNGRDLFHAQCYTNTSAGTRGAGYIAVSTGTTNETASSTALETEIASGGLSRADATTKTHSAGTNSTLIEHTFTAGATHTNVHKSACFNAASGVTMTHVANFTADATLQSGDTLKVSWTNNLG